MTGHVTSRYPGLNSSEIGAKNDNLDTRLSNGLLIWWKNELKGIVNHWQDFVSDIQAPSSHDFVLCDFVM
jgi:hypothetical protein